MDNHCTLCGRDDGEHVCPICDDEAHTYSSVDDIVRHQMERNHYTGSGARRGKLDNYLTKHYVRRLKCKYPLLALAARVALIYSASEIACERMFSRAGRILRGDRCRMSASTLEQLVLLVLNGRAVGLLRDQ